MSKDDEKFLINLCVIIFGNYIIFGQAELYGLFGFKFYSDYHLNSIYIYYCCFWLVVFCYVLLCISLCVYCKFMCIRMYWYMYTWYTEDIFKMMYPRLIKSLSIL